MKYKCLVLDHDDTVVKSTPTIHYPSFIEAMKVLRPELTPYTLEEFVNYCFDPGFDDLCRVILKYTDDESSRQQEIWRRYTGSVIPQFYKGFSELISNFRASGGYICVVSHSEKNRILRDYKKTLNIEPDMIFGWEGEAHQRKPNPYPLEAIMRQFNLKRSELLMVDDLKPGLDMARSCGIDFACAGWSHMIPSIVAYMRQNSDYYFEDVNALATLVLERQ
ncbi:HAD family hydrolase [Fusibacter ferrireducens]|uniref:HAD family hydrolase n=1 Tax=Fusibacter ferrireducens TaxID=2785058 RepID=A0ABR9ZSI5_9FIRM|nr:HAD hydrolase-like protein [Fusibacter ferrireducens]MBF4693410.1 HAD family hydrolase [Fusibacter ferrireducens]